jgi:hypothetical protein
MYSNEFMTKLSELNTSISRSLTSRNLEPVLIGNLFYDHLEVNFQNNPLNPLLEQKRQRLASVAKKCSNAFEVGVNGGHSAFLMLQSNQELNYIGNDIAAFYPPEPRCHPEVYVPAAFDSLKQLFPERVQTITGDCITELPKYASANNRKHIDLLHLDGNKKTYEADFFTMLPLLRPGAYVVFDDTQIPIVNKLVSKLLDKHLIVHSEYPTMESREKYRHEIVNIYPSKTNG